MRAVNRRRFIETVGATSIVATIAGCMDGDDGNGGDDSDGGDSPDGDSGDSDSNGGSSVEQIGFSGYVRGGSWITAYNEATEFYAEEMGVEMDIRPNEQSTSQQVQDIRDFVNQGYDAIIVNVWDTGGAEGAINEAMEAGIPVIATNADTSSSEIPLYVGFSNQQGGQLCAEAMVEALEEQRGDQDEWNVLDVRGPTGNQSADQRSQGFLDHMEEQDDVNVLDSLNGEYAREDAQTVTQEWIQANETPDGIYSGNLSMGLGVVNALESLDMMVPAGEDDHIILTQMDGSEEVNGLVGDGTIDAAVDQPNYFYNPIGMEYLEMYVEEGPDAMPEVGDTVEAGDIDMHTGEHMGVELWSEPIWAPAEIDEQNGHPWFKTNAIVITEENYDQPYLWGNVWGEDTGDS